MVDNENKTKESSDQTQGTPDPKTDDSKTQKKVEDSESDLDEKIRSRKEEALKAREAEVEKREAKQDDQRKELNRMMEEVERSGKGFAPKEPKSDSPEEYADKLAKGEVNPFKDDKIK